MNYARVSAVVICLLLSTVSRAATLDGPKPGKKYRTHERIVCSGSCGVADGAIVAMVKDTKNVVRQSYAIRVDGDTYTVILKAPSGGWPVGEAKLEIVSGKEGKTQASIKIEFEE